MEYLLKGNRLIVKLIFMQHNFILSDFFSEFLLYIFLYIFTNLLRTTYARMKGLN